MSPILNYGFGFDQGELQCVVLQFSEKLQTSNQGLHSDLSLNLILAQALVEDL